MLTFCELSSKFSNLSGVLGTPELVVKLVQSEGALGSPDVWLVPQVRTVLGVLFLETVQVA